MDARDSMKAIIISIVTISALAGLPSIASAQQWDPWDGDQAAANRSSLAARR